MISQALKDIVSVVGQLDDRPIKERILSYFSEISKHHEVSLANHYKMLFQFICEVQSATLHIQILSLAQRHLQKRLLTQSDFHVFIEYFRVLSDIRKQKLHLKAAQLILTMTAQMDKNNISVVMQLAQIISIYEKSQSNTPDTAKQCVAQFTNKMKEIVTQMSNNNIQLLMRQLLSKIHNSTEQQSYDQCLLLTLIDILLNRLTNTSQFTNILLKKQKHLSKQARQQCLKMVVSSTHDTDSVILTLIAYSKQHQNNKQLALNQIKSIYSRKQLGKQCYHVVGQVGSLIESILLGHSRTSVKYQCCTMVVLSQILESVGSSAMPPDEQQNMTKEILRIMRQPMRIVNNSHFKAALLKIWTDTYHLMVKKAFKYMTQTDLVLMLAKSEQDLIVDVIEKYDRYFTEEEYWTVYHIIYCMKLHGVYDSTVEKLDLHLFGLKKLLIDSINRKQIDEAQFTINTVRQLLMRHDKETPSVKRRLQQLAILLSDRGTTDIIKIFLNMVEDFILKRKNITVWVSVLQKSSQIEQPDLRIKILQMLNDICANCPQLLPQETWLEILRLLQDYMSLRTQQLSAVILIMQIIIQQCMHSFSQNLVSKLMDTMMNMPMDDRMNAKLKYKLCGLLWTIGQKQKSCLNLVASKLEEICKDDIAQVAINALCVYSSLGNYDGYESLWRTIHKAGKQSVIISYLHNYVKVIKKTINSEMYYKVTQFMVASLPQLYDMAFSQLMIEATIFHHQLSRVMYKDILRDPDCFQLTLSYYISFMSEKPKEGRLVRYSIPKMMVQLLNQVQWISSHQQMQSTPLMKVYIDLLVKILSYPVLAATVINIQKNKIYFEEQELKRILQIIYGHMASNRELLTVALYVMPISANHMIQHGGCIKRNRIPWIKHIGQPRNYQMAKKYAQVYREEEEIEFFRNQLWSVKYYLAAHGVLEMTNIPNEIGFEMLCDIIQYQVDDCQLTVSNKAKLVKVLLERAINELKKGKDKALLVGRLNRLTIHPQSMRLVCEQPWLHNKKGHLCYLTVILSQLAIRSDSNELRELIMTALSSISTALCIPN